MINRNIKGALLGAAALACLNSGGAQAQTVEVGVGTTCPETGPGIAICAAAGVVLFELVKVLNGQNGFGENGEIMKILAAPGKIIHGNIRASERESGVGAKVLRGTLGISFDDMRKHGLWGGSNSFFRKPFG